MPSTLTDPAAIIQMLNELIQKPPDGQPTIALLAGPERTRYEQLTINPQHNTGGNTHVVIGVHTHGKSNIRYFHVFADREPKLLQDIAELELPE